MGMKTFKEVAFEILKREGKPLRSDEIVKRALKQGLLVTDGRTPQATMYAELIVDINKKGDMSKFRKTGPATFAINPDYRKPLATKTHQVRRSNRTPQVRPSKDLSSKQKGDIAEAMIAQLITLYGNKLACFKPMTDDDGVDLIVKVKGGRDIVCLQVKSRFEGKRGGVFTATARRLPSDSGPLIDALAYVFCAFDNKKGDLWDYLWLVPAREFVSKANPLRGGRLGFVAGRGRKSGKWDEYLIHKRELAQTLQRLLDQMKKHNSPRSASHLPSSNARALDHS